MSEPFTLPRRRTRVANRLAAWTAGRGRPATAFVTTPEPRSIGSLARGRQLVAGNLLFAGYLVESADVSLWEVTAPTPAFDAERHGFAWLDDLAAVGGMEARLRSQRWLWHWIDLYGRGQGPGWTPDLTGRRVIRWIHHAIFLLHAQQTEDSRRFFRALSRQAWFLARRWKAAAPGLPRFEALTGLIYAGLSLEGMEELADPAIRALAQECESQIDAEGGLPTRNPEDLLEVFSLLIWAAALLHEAGRGLPAAHAAAIRRIAPTLRALRHADGGLARFHGGDRGLEGRLDQTLAASQVKARRTDGLAMGYARLAAGRTTLLVDAGAPPQGKASYNAHASALAFELTSGRRPLIVNCGSGAPFGPEWRRAGRATPSHSCLCLDGYSSARLAEPARQGGAELLTNGPREVPGELSHGPEGLRLQLAHDGHVARHGLTIARTLELSPDGRAVSGEEMLLALDDRAKRRFDEVMDAGRLSGIPFALRFHLHPEVDASVDLDGTIVSMALKNGEIWLFRSTGQTTLSLPPRVYLEKGRLKPRATKQVVLSGRAMQYATRVRWSLAKSQDTAIAARDLRATEPALQD
jgi:uncharacterized heparinase superfamily protein